MAIYIQTVTDNKNRTVSEIRRALTRGGGSLGEAGSVGWLFDSKGYIAVDMAGRNQDKVFELALEAGAEDVQFGDEMAEIYTAPADLQAVRQAFMDAKYKLEDAELTMIPKTSIALSPADTLQVMNLVETLEDLDDVAKVYSNLEISEEALARWREAEVELGWRGDLWASIRARRRRATAWSPRMRPARRGWCATASSTTRRACRCRSGCWRSTASSRR